MVEVVLFLSVEEDDDDFLVLVVADGPHIFQCSMFFACSVEESSKGKQSIGCERMTGKSREQARKMRARLLLSLQCLL